MIKLHVGCGPRILKGWINIDLLFEPYENYLKYYGDTYYSENQRGDYNDFISLDAGKNILPFLDNTVDVIFSEDFIEHLSQKNQIFFLAECYRVLKPGCVNRINTPDLVESMKRNSNFQKGGAGLYNHEWDKHKHICLLTKNTLGDYSKMIGYSDIVFNGKGKSLSDLVPTEYRPDKNDREEYENIFADLVK